MANIALKYCGLTTQDAVEQALKLKIDYIGLVCVPKSVRYKDGDILASFSTIIHSTTAYNPKVVCLFANQDNAHIIDVAGFINSDIIQLHGHETPNDCRYIKEQTGQKIIKAFLIKKDDTTHTIQAMIQPYIDVIDYILCDTSPPKHSSITGGHGVSFNWDIIANMAWPLPLFLAGGLHADNVVDAITLTTPYAVDVSSHIERVKGVKDTILMQQFAHKIRSV